jgi:acyl-CoA reductase-like NAD-dependent aldehyde dehydrogenase
MQTTQQQNHETIPAVDPANGERLGELRSMDRAEVGAAVSRARAAQVAWGTTTFGERRRVLRTLAELIVERHESICEIAVRDSGKTMVDAALGEVFPVLEKIRYVLRHGERDLRTEKRSSGILAHKSARVEYLPLGVVGVICPWNFPFHNLLCPLVPALFAGNGVVSKVSEHTSWSAEPYLALVRDALVRHGHDPELVQVVTGYGATGNYLVTSGVEKIFFTGSPQNGRKVMEAASAAPTEVVLELGGKDPMIVCDDADLEHAAEQAMLGVFTACGQMCVGVERVYVHDAVYDAFVAKVTAGAQRLRQGVPPHPGRTGKARTTETVDCGAMTMPRQLDILDELVADAVTQGARVLVGGGRASDAGPQFFAPTILVDVTHEMRIAREEQFGPIMVIFRVRSDEHAIECANDTEYGLGSSVFTRDAARGDRIARQLRTGMTVINDYGIAYMVQALPFGGEGISGVGRINGREGLRGCCHVKAVVADRWPLSRLPSRGGVSVYPIQETTYALVQSVSGLIYAPGMRAKAGHALKAARTFARELRSRHG